METMGLATNYVHRPQQSFASEKRGISFWADVLKSTLVALRWPRNSYSDYLNTEDFQRALLGLPAEEFGHGSHHWCIRVERLRVPEQKLVERDLTAAVFIQLAPIAMKPRFGNVVLVLYLHQFAKEAAEF